MTSDPYLYPETNVLRNRFNLHTAEELTKEEARFVTMRQIDLSMRPVGNTFDTAHLKAIHEHLFQDVYDWAGHFRTVGLSIPTSERPDAPLDTFIAPEYLEAFAKSLFEDLRRKDYLRGLDRDAFATEASSFFAKVNGLHPFRDGNGRTQRAFITELANHAGHHVDFHVVSRERMVRASILARRGDNRMLERMFAEISDPVRVAALDGAIQAFEHNRYPWRQTYLTTSTEDQTYTGTLVGRSRDGQHFIFCTDNRDIIVAHQADISPTHKAGEHMTFTARTPFSPPAHELGEDVSL